MESKIDSTNPDSVFLNPEYLESLNQESLNQVPEISDDEFREFILTHNYEMPIELQKYVEEYMSNPLNRTDSKILGWIKDWIEHPEKSKIYRDQILFRPISQIGDDKYDPPEKGWKIEIPIISIDF